MLSPYSVRDKLTPNFAYFTPEISLSYTSKYSPQYFVFKYTLSLLNFLWTQAVIASVLDAKKHSDFKTSQPCFFSDQFFSYYRTLKMQENHTISQNGK